jgi:hypothetical protein
LNDAVAVEILLLPGFPQFSLPSRLADPKALGDALAEYTTRFHHSLAARGVFSPRLMDFCLVDVHRVIGLYVRASDANYEGTGW